MATARVSNSYSSTTVNRQQYVCDCGRKCISQTELNEHKANCEKQALQCSFCQESQPSSRQLSEHLLQCGNKTDQCPNCQKFIRRAIFAYHYENGCANLDEPDNSTPTTRISSSHRPSSNISKPVPKNSDFIDDDQENNSDSTSINNHLDKLQQISSATSRNKSPTDIKECRYCQHRCLRSDYEAHKRNCLRNPKNLNKDQQRTSFIPEKPESRPSTNADHRSKDIVQIPCEFCNEPIDLNLWSTHTEDCRKKEKRRIEALAKVINDEPVIERLPCEHCEELFSVTALQAHEALCRKNPEYIARLARTPTTLPSTTPSLFNGLTNTQRDSTLLSRYSSLPSTHTSGFKPSPSTRDILDEFQDRDNDATLRHERSSSHVTINPKPTLERSRSRDRDRSSFGTNEHQLPKQPRANDHIGSQLINSSNDVSAYGTSSLLKNYRSLSPTQSLLHRIHSALSLDRLLTDRQSEEYPPVSRRAPSPSIYSSYSPDVSRTKHNDRGSLRATSSKANRPLLAPNNILFSSSHDEDLEHQPIINDRGHSARYKTRPKSSSSVFQPPMNFTMKKNEYGF